MSDKGLTEVSLGAAVHLALIGERMPAAGTGSLPSARREKAYLAEPGIGSARYGKRSRKNESSMYEPSV